MAGDGIESPIKKEASMRITWTMVIGFTVLLVACAAPQPQPVQMQTKFDYEMHKPYVQKGNNTIKGQGFLRQQGGGVVTCAGRDVLLFPATPYFREFITIVNSRKKLITDPVDPAYRDIMKRSQGDAQGNFISQVSHQVTKDNYLLLL